MSMFIFLGILSAKILLNTPVTIYLHDYPSQQIFFRKGDARIKHVKDEVPSLHQSSLAIIKLVDQEYQITHLGLPLCNVEDGKEVSVCPNNDKSYEKSLWKISTANYGYLIMQNNLCLTKSKYDEYEKNYLLELSQCKNRDTQLWEIEPPELTSEEYEQSLLEHEQNIKRISYYS